MPKRNKKQSPFRKDLVLGLTIGLVIGFVILLFASMQMHLTEDQSLSSPDYSNAP